jgi:hypothetical protein
MPRQRAKRETLPYFAELQAFLGNMESWPSRQKKLKELRHSKVPSLPPPLVARHARWHVVGRE